MLTRMTDITTATIGGYRGLKVIRVSAPLLRELKIRAAEDGSTLHEFADQALRTFLETGRKKSKVKPS